MLYVCMSCETERCIVNDKKEEEKGVKWVSLELEFGVIVGNSRAIIDDCWSCMRQSWKKGVGKL